MIEYVQPHDPDDRVISRAAALLRDGGLVAYPTDSSWAIGCSSESKKGIDNLTSLHPDKRSQFSLICEDISQISSIANFDTATFKLLKKYLPGPYVFILNSVKKIEKKIGVKRPEIGIRLPNHEIPRRIVQALGAPIFSTTASKNMTDVYNQDPGYAEENLFEYGWELEDIQGLSLIIDSGEALEKRLSTVVRLDYDQVELIRQGIGEWKE